MLSETRKVILYIAMSLDGYIAQPHDDLTFLSIVEQEGEDYGYHEFTQTVDTVIMGRRTYDKVLSFGIPFPHADKQTYIITRAAKPSEGNIHFYNGDLPTLIQQLKAQAGKDIFLDGGAEAVFALMQHHLIDEYIISIIPIFVGAGISLFKADRPAENLQLISAKSFEKGLVQLHYKRVWASNKAALID